MKRYELITIISEEADEKKLAEISKKIQKIITEQNGKIESVDDMGRKKLAYPIKKNQFGNYLVIKFEAEKSAINQIKSDLTPKHHLLRMMLVSLPATVEEIKKPKKKIKAAAKVKRKITKPAISRVKKIKVSPEKIAKPAEPISEEIESEEERIKKLEEELGKILEE